MSGDVLSVSVSAEVFLSLDEWFPDGVPDPVTFADVLAQVTKSSSAADLLDEWNLEPEVVVTWKRRNPHAGQIDIDGNEQPAYLFDVENFDGSLRPW